MEMNLPIITKFISVLKISDKKGFSKFKERRDSSVFIVVLRGKICFVQDGEEFIATPDSPIYIPRGATYFNKFIENSESLLFNFEETEPSLKMRPLSRIEELTATRIFERILILRSRNTLAAEAEMLSLLYSLAACGYAEGITRKRQLIAPAVKYVDLHLADPTLTVSRLAEICCISTVYFDRLFKRELFETPISYIIRRRMETARDMLAEHRSVGETASAVGYSDIYQFSRAFKKFYGVSPKKYENMSF